MRPANPYRLAPPRALAPAPRPPGRLLTWWRDLVGAAVALACWPVAWQRYCEARRRERVAAWSRAYAREVVAEGLRLAGFDVNATPMRMPTLDSHGAPCPADPDRYPRVVDLTRAPPRVATGAVGEPARLGAPGGDWRAAALGMWLRDEARANARKE